MCYERTSWIQRCFAPFTNRWICKFQSSKFLIMLKKYNLLTSNQNKYEITIHYRFTPSFGLIWHDVLAIMFQSFRKRESAALSIKTRAVATKIWHLAGARFVCPLAIPSLMRATRSHFGLLHVILDIRPLLNTVNKSLNYDGRIQQHSCPTCFRTPNLPSSLRLRSCYRKVVKWSVIR